MKLLNMLFLMKKEKNNIFKDLFIFIDDIKDGKINNSNKKKNIKIGLVRLKIGLEICQTLLA